MCDPRRRVHHLVSGSREARPEARLREGRNEGAGQITVTSFSAPVGSLDFWRWHITAHGLTVEDETSPFDEDTIRFRDPSGLLLRIVGSQHDARSPWTVPDISKDEAIRGIHGVTISVRDPAKTIALLTEMLDGAVVGESADTTRIGVGGNAPGQIVEVARAKGAADAVNGLGTVHHVAFAVGDEDQQLEIRQELLRRGIRVTEVLDRQYFRSIYFREPNGVLFEIATVPPGFTADESLADLGRALKLPPWEEPRRATIQAGLPTVTH